MKILIKTYQFYVKTFMILIITYFISMILISLLTIPVDNFYGSMQDYCDLLFLDFSQFTKWAISKYNITLYFIFIIVLQAIFTLYNKGLNDIHNYDCMIRHRYVTNKNFILSVIKRQIKKMIIFVTIDVVALFGAYIMLTFSFNFSINYFNIIFFLLARHFLIASISVILKLKSLDLKFNNYFLFFFIFLLIIMSLDISLPTKFITFSLMDLETPWLYFSLLFYLAIPIYLLLKLLIKGGNHNNDHIK